ncbi:polysaccharide deacetylase family protein [Halobacillus mangrovi]|uniref:Polysaccharide deacetylase n=1 Tax=Halobacillus mangrovi TaxID=402384 RepID=A0A1W5ZWF4_9BACI|nr:polysaccharide deacetylase family protein [Halobacillus mangrovi]ARI77625.1 polysaccharide deacetylase [Halobacillus mangrovi]
MKKWVGMMLLVLLLTACSGASSVSNQEEQSKEEQKTEQSKKNEENEKTEKEEEQKDNETTEPANTTPAEPQYQLTGNWSFEPIGDANPKVALITIDDAPDNQGVEMAKTLKHLNAPAIFFVNGHFIDTPEGAEELKKIHEMGFPIGNHTYSHSSLPDLSQEEQKEEIIGLNDRIEEIIGERPKFFRAPFGQNTEYSKQLAAEENMLLMNWTYGYDWNQEYMDATKLADIMVNTDLLGNGANLLMHDREWTAKALPDIVQGLKDKGYELLNPALIKTP